MIEVKSSENKKKKKMKKHIVGFGLFFQQSQGFLFEMLQKKL